MSNARNVSKLGGLAAHVANLIGLSNTKDTITPSGVVLSFAGSAAPSGWLLCYGQAISRTTNAALWNIIGTTYGAGDGSTTFNLPDLRGRVPAGKDNMGGTAANRLTTFSNNLGTAGGAETHALTNSQMPSHSHTLAYDTASGTNTASNRVITTSGTTGAGASATTSTSGAGADHNNVQPSIVLNYIIKT